jgi:hypothetical protein
MHSPKMEEESNPRTKISDYLIASMTSRCVIETVKNPKSFFCYVMTKLQIQEIIGSGVIPPQFQNVIRL